MAAQQQKQQQQQQQGAGRELSFRRDVLLPAVRATVRAAGYLTVAGFAGASVYAMLVSALSVPKSECGVRHNLAQPVHPSAPLGAGKLRVNS